MAEGIKLFYKKDRKWIGPMHYGWKLPHGWPGAISEYMHIFGVNLLEIDEMFWIGRKNIKLHMKSVLSYAESEVADSGFFGAPPKV